MDRLKGGPDEREVDQEGAKGSEKERKREESC